MEIIRSFLFLCVTCLGAFFFFITPVHAQETIEQTLVYTYEFSPELRAAKERLAREKEALSEAWTGFQPTATLDYSIGRQRDDNDVRTAHADINEGALNIDQPLFEGFGNMAAVQRARLEVAAAEQTYNAISQDVFLDATIAHISVARDFKLYEIAQKNEAALQERLQATQARHESGVLTRTDVYQAQTRLADSQALTFDAAHALDVSSSTYLQLAGQKPVNPVLPKTFPGLPSSLEEALKEVEENNPELAVSYFLTRAAKKEISEARADLWPRMFLRGRMERNYNDGTSLSDDTENDSLTLNLSVPLYQAGSVRTEIRQATATSRESRETHKSLRQRVIQKTSENWHALEAARKIIQSREYATDRAYQALVGYSKEFKAGNRSAVDVLDAERDLFETESALARARADKAIAAYRLLRSMGASTGGSEYVIRKAGDKTFQISKKPEKKAP